MNFRLKASFVKFITCAVVLVNLLIYGCKNETKKWDEKKWFSDLKSQFKPCRHKLCATVERRELSPDPKHNTIIGAEIKVYAYQITRCADELRALNECNYNVFMESVSWYEAMERMVYECAEEIDNFGICMYKEEEKSIMEARKRFPEGWELIKSGVTVEDGCQYPFSPITINGVVLDIEFEMDKGYLIAVSCTSPEGITGGGMWGVADCYFFPPGVGRISCIVGYEYW